MLDGLNNVDLSGITGRIVYNSGDIVTSTMGSGLLALAIIGLLLIFLSSLLSPTKTELHRRVMVDLYVAGTIRKLAKEEGIDLEEEYQQFLKQSKRKNIRYEKLDHAIELEKAELIIDEAEKAKKQ